MSYVYHHVTLDRVVDGDTVVLVIDTGNRCFWRDSFRLMGIDTPERGQPGYIEASTFLTQLLAGGLSRVETFKPDKYGRWLADLYVLTGDSGEMHINTRMVQEGHAKAYSGGNKT